jgi:putative membrane protein
MAIEIHPLINAVLNGTAGALIVAGRLAIARGDRAAHKSRMLAAVATSTVFLISYLARFATTGAHYYPHAGPDKYIYLFILFSHMALAVVLVPLVLRALLVARRGDLPAHKRVVRWAWPIWAYVSVTGVVVYVMLYHLAPALNQ